MLSIARHFAKLIKTGDDSRKRTAEPSFCLPMLDLSATMNGCREVDFKLGVSQIDRPKNMVLPLVDLVSIAAICRGRKPKRIFEIGTFRGETTWVMSRHLSPESEIFTLDLPPDEIPPHFVKYTAGEYFLGTAEASRISQLYGWSQNYDFTPYFGSIDFVFVDGDHSYDAVKIDSNIARKLVRPGGIIIWDDYRYLPCHESCRGVSDFLHSVQEESPVRQIQGTRLACLIVE